MTKEEIFETAEKHFFARRYSDVKLDNIANALNIRKPSLYYYFTDKKDLFLQTLKYSFSKYIEDLKEIVEHQDLDKFIEWYLVYPSLKKNLFAISFQKGYCVDDVVNAVIFNGKMTVNKIINQLFSSFEVDDVKIYLITNLLDKLAQDNCIEGYCLKHSLVDIQKQIKKFIMCK